MGGDLERPTPMKLCKYFFSDNFVERVADSSNKYRRATASRGDLRQDAITSNDILKFFSILVYMGLVPLNNKEDYWYPSPPMPYHDHVQCMSYKRFKHIWYGAPFLLLNSFQGNTFTSTLTRISREIRVRQVMIGTLEVRVMMKMRT